MATNPEQARRWMRWAWLGGLAWWVWTMVVLMVWISAPVLAESEAEGAAPAIPPAKLLIYYGIEGFAIALLALGVMRRWRAGSYAACRRLRRFPHRPHPAGPHHPRRFPRRDLAGNIRVAAVRLRARSAGRLQLPLVHPPARAWAPSDYRLSHHAAHHHHHAQPCHRPRLSAAQKPRAGCSPSPFPLVGPTFSIPKRSRTVAPPRCFWISTRWDWCDPGAEQPTRPAGSSST